MNGTQPGLGKAGNFLLGEADRFTSPDTAISGSGAGPVRISSWPGKSMAQRRNSPVSGSGSVTPTLFALHDLGECFAKSPVTTRVNGFAHDAVLKSRRSFSRSVPGHRRSLLRSGLQQGSRSAGSSVEYASSRWLANARLPNRRWAVSAVGYKMN